MHSTFTKSYFHLPFSAYFLHLSYTLAHLVYYILILHSTNVLKEQGHTNP